MAVKKKSAAKKVAKKSPAKKAVAKKVAQKSPAKKVAKKAVAKRVAKKSPAKKSPAKKVAKKAVAKKVAKKSPAKKVAKKAVAKKIAAKSPITAATVIPPVPTGTVRERANISTTPVAATTVAKSAATAQSAASRKGSSKGVLVAVLLGVAILVAIVLSGQSENSDDAAPAPTATAQATTEPTAQATTEPTAEASESPAPETTEAVASGAAPTNFIGNWSDSNKTTLRLTWRAPAGDVTAYKLESSFNGGVWGELAELPATQLSQEVLKTSADKYTSFRVSAVYADGSIGVARAFGFAGTFE